MRLTGSSWTGRKSGTSWTGTSWTGTSWTGTSWTGTSWTGSESGAESAVPALDARAV